MKRFLAASALLLLLVADARNSSGGETFKPPLDKGRLGGAYYEKMSVKKY
jgi:hypothetical protein